MIGKQRETLPLTRSGFYSHYLIATRGARWLTFDRGVKCATTMVASIEEGCNENSG